MNVLFRLSRPWIQKTWRSFYSASITAPTQQVVLEHHRSRGSSASKQDSQQLVDSTSSIDTPATVAVITLNRPQAANAMGKIFLDQFQDILETLQNHHSTISTRCVIVTSSSSKVFSAGADLKERKTMNVQETEAFVTRLRTTMEDFANLSVPTIAAVEGVAVGGGLELALAADLRVAATTATLGLPETSLAIVPGAGGTQRLPRLIGLARAKELVYTAQRIDGVTARDYGLVQHVVEPGRTLDKALELAWKIAANGPIAIQAAKFAMNQGMTCTNLADALDVERQAYERVLTTKDRLEGLQAFQEGRKPVYRGQ